MKHPLPTLRSITRRLRELHEAWSHPIAGGAYVELRLHYDNWNFYQWQVNIVGQPRCCDWGPPCGREWIPGDGAPFDAVAAARRLLAAARDAETPYIHTTEQKNAPTYQNLGAETDSPQKRGIGVDPV